MHAHSRFLSSRRGFTLVELLTVIAIIAVLAAIIIPSVRHVRKTAVTSTALNNARELGKTFALYAQDNRNQWPATNNANVFWSKDALFPYLTGRTAAGWNDLADTIFVSPSAAPVGETDGPDQPAIVDQGNRGFAMNNGLPDTGGASTGGSTHPKLPARIVSPPRTAVLMDCNAKQIPATTPSFRNQYTTMVENRHGGRNVVLFADGHTELVAHADIPVSNSGTAAANAFWFGR